MPSVVEVVGVEEDVVEDVGVEEEAEISSRVQAPLQPLPPVVGPSTLTFRPVMVPATAPCISNSGNKLTFVLIQAPAHGRMCSRQDLKNETGTIPKLTTL